MTVNFVCRLDWLSGPVNWSNTHRDVAMLVVFTGDEDYMSRPSVRQTGRQHVRRLV